MLVDSVKLVTELERIRAEVAHGAMRVAEAPHEKFVRLAGKYEGLGEAIDVIKQMARSEDD